MLHLSCQLKIFKLHHQYNSSYLPKLITPLLVTASYITKNHYVHNLSDLVCYTTTMLNYTSFYIDDHLKKLDEWRETEADYEEKTDPPKWTLKIKDESEYIIKHFALGKNFFSNFIYISILLQVVILFFSSEKLFALFDCIPDLFHYIVIK